ncbi:hypothetical protein AM504_22225 [Klebsiella michiganensis]|nr:hypothetical protein BJF97_11220 [Klebsiella sp. LTGPAF-6F]KLU46827.1 hypothetical protein ABE84_15435 [Klebsiella michiganensis]KLU48470.1 hypothetical protein ABE97_10435 [Klebsiella michiganensis]
MKSGAREEIAGAEGKNSEDVLFLFLMSWQLCRAPILHIGDQAEDGYSQQNHRDDKEQDT